MLGTKTLAAVCAGPSGPASKGRVIHSSRAIGGIVAGP